MNRHIVLLAAAAILAASAAQAVASSGIIIRDGWFRALPAGTPAGGYFTLQNGSRKSITLTGVASPSCGEAMLHESKSDGGMKGMTHVSNLVVPAGGTLSFAPGGYHIMCMMPIDLMPGGKADVTFNFADGSKQTVSFVVKNALGK
jgi:copper(I)-binding protein